MIHRDAVQIREAALKAETQRLLNLRELEDDQPTESFDPVVDPGMIFYIVAEDGVEKVDIYLDEPLHERLCHIDDVAWSGLIEYIEQDITDRD